MKYQGTSLKNNKDGYRWRGEVRDKSKKALMSFEKTKEEKGFKVGISMSIEEFSKMQVLLKLKLVCVKQM